MPPFPADRLVTALQGREGLPASYEAIAHEANAVSLGMYGSPTLLIDGADPFAEPTSAPTMSCRLYRDNSGQTAGDHVRCGRRMASDLTLWGPGS